MLYTFNPAYTAIADSFPTTRLPRHTTNPIVVIPKALTQQETRETYATVRRTLTSGKGFSRASVYDAADGTTAKTEENYRKTDIFPHTVVFNHAVTLAKLEAIVNQVASAAWGVGELELANPWWVGGYGVQDKFEQHCDGAVRLLDGSYKLVERRMVTSLCYLNTKDSNLIGFGYSGGSLVFPGITDTDGKPLTYEPKEGDLVIFPSSWEYCHAVTPITTGYRTAITTFHRLKQ